MEPTLFTLLIFQTPESSRAFFKSQNTYYFKETE